MMRDVLSCLVQRQPGWCRLNQQPDSSWSPLLREQALTRGIYTRDSKQSLVFQVADRRLGHSPGDRPSLTGLTKGSAALRYA